jgi:hypothetical protein
VLVGEIKALATTTTTKKDFPHSSAKGRHFCFEEFRPIFFTPTFYDFFIRTLIARRPIPFQRFVFTFNHKQDAVTPLADKGSFL